MTTLLTNTIFKKSVKQKMIAAISGLWVAILIPAPIAATPIKTLSLDALNTNIKWCFDATQNIAEIIEAKDELKNITKPCDKLLRNKIKPGNVEANALFNRGVIYFHAGQLDSAAQDFTEALQHSPELYQANIALGEIAIKQESLQKALSFYESAIETNEADAVLNKRRNWLVAKLQGQAL